MVRRIWPVIAAIALVLGGLTPTGAVAQPVAQEQVRTFVGDMAGLENIGAKFVVLVAPDRRAAAFLGSRDENFNRSYAKWYIGAVNGRHLVATASDGTLLTGTVEDGTVTGTIAAGEWTGTVDQTGTAGLYRSQVSADEVDIAIVAADGSWVGMAFSPSGQLLRTWNSGTGLVQRVANTTAVRVQPAPNAPPVQLDLIQPAPGATFYAHPSTG